MHEGHAADGRRDREVVCDADLRKIVRNSQIYATSYVWTRPFIYKRKEMNGGARP